MRRRRIGDAEVSAVGLGAMPLSIDGRPDREQAIATVHAALEAGVTLIDTADAYCLDEDDFGHSEVLVAEALASAGDAGRGVLVATKGGHVRPGGDWKTDGRPEHLQEAARASAKRLGVDAVGLYQFHRPDPSVPFAESVGALKELLDAGVIVRAGISNTDVDQIREARSILGEGLAAVQNQFSSRFTSSRGELDLCAELGIAFLPWSPLGGIGKAADLAEHAAFAEIARDRGVSPQQVTLAWELALSPTVVPIPGSSRPASITDSAAAADLTLTEAELARLS